MYKYKLDDFKKGMPVRYVPTHAAGDLEHEDCRKGVVSYVSARIVFVKYDCGKVRCTSCVIDEDMDICPECKGKGEIYTIIMKTGDEDYTAQGTSPEDLVIL